jgi:hypothetical protein
LKHGAKQNFGSQRMQALLQPFQMPSCIIVGAGISYSPPSNVATVSYFLNELLRALPLSARDRKELTAAASPDWLRGVGYYDFLRFEQVMSALHYTIDKDLTLATRIIEGSTPNAYHHQVALLIARGHLVFTTNFDSLIEEAAHKLGIPCTPIVSEAQYSLYHRQPERFSNPLFKLHGSLLGDESHSQSITATFQAAVDETTVNPAKWKVVNSLLRSRNLLVIGYSGSDDFDVMPAIAQGGGADRQLLWIQHSRKRNLVLYDTDALAEAADVPSKVLWFLGRLFGEFAHRPLLQWTESRVAFCMGPTSNILDALSGRQSGSFLLERPRLSRARRSQIIRSEIRSRISSARIESILLSGLLFQRIGLFDAAIRHLRSAYALTSHAEGGRSSAHLFAALSDIYWQRGESDYCAWATESLVAMVLQCERLSIVETIEFSRVVSQACLLTGQAIKCRPPQFRGAGITSSISRISQMFEFDRRVNLLRQNLERSLHLAPGECGERRDSSSAVRPHITNEELAELDTLGRLLKRRPEKEPFAHYRYIAGLVAFATERALSIAGYSKATGNKVDIDTTLDAARKDYEELGRYRRLADAFLLHARSYSFSGWFDFTYEFAACAFQIYEKIGNLQAARDALSLLKDVESRVTHRGIDRVDSLRTVIKRAARHAYK